ncbi:MAG: hypothetical protein J5922_03570 [Clostridia bacterium]|nr:hypothetical protein [Clostridia bacterium]
MSKVKVGLLPLYVEIYDTYNPERRPHIEAFYKKAVAALESRGCEVIEAPVCRKEHEFKDAISNFEKNGADALVTLHLAYSPSLEAEKVLANTSLPIIIMDTTPDYKFFSATVDGRYLTAYNHGIHGVQDMCTLLHRNRKDYQIFAGHLDHSDVADKVTAAALGAKMAKALRSMKVGTIGGIYDGMGDFRVPYDRLEKELGIKTVIFDEVKAKKELSEITDDQIDKLCAETSEMFKNENAVEEVLREDARFAAVVRSWIEKNDLRAFTMNFLTAQKDSGFPYPPYIETCKQMARGIGYGGEGDVLTASLMGAVLSVYRDTAFVEMFCPDWAGNAIYLSHLGEVSPNLTVAKPRLYDLQFPYPNTNRLVKCSGTYRAGKGVYVSLAPTDEGEYTLVLSEVEMFEHPDYHDDQPFVAGWFRPDMPVADFLEEFSAVGGTHHGIFVYGADLLALASFGSIMGFDVEII